jgi:dihydroxy-acid dehydratase
MGNGQSRAAFLAQFIPCSAFRVQITPMISRPLRSARWFDPDDLRSFGHRSRLKQMGYERCEFSGRPVIAILNTWSDLNTCHTHFRERADDVKRGVWQAGGFPVELPVVSLGEMLMKPTTMFYRNLLAMEVEEVLRCHPVDGAVLMGGCDKTVPGLLMGAFSMDLPCVFLPAGPMLKGRWRDQTLGSGSDVWKYWYERGAGRLSCSDWEGLEDGIARSPGTCMTMGTASTMAALTEAMGFTLPGAATIPAVHSAHARMAAACGRRIVQMVHDDLRPSGLLSREVFENAIVTLMTLGGSTNAVIHLLAMARRAGVMLELDDFDRIPRQVPVLLDLRPAGRFLMEDFHEAGGMPALLHEIRDLLHTHVPTISGFTLGDSLGKAECLNPEVIRPRSQPLSPEGGIAVLRGNLAPQGCVIKHSAADPRLLVHRGPALAFADYAEMKRRLEDDALPVTPDSVLVLKSAGPVGGPGMPEWGLLPIPRKLLREGVRDMVRISDARMSGTAFGACVLHVSPESAIGGPLGLVRDGDIIELNVPERRVHWHVPPDEEARRRQQWRPPPPRFVRGYGLLSQREISQADEGCDFRFLAGNLATPEPDIY